MTTHAQEPNWQPISALPMFAHYVDEMLANSEEQYETLSEASSKPHVLDDETVDRVIRLYTEQLKTLRVYRKQLDRWNQSQPSEQQKQEIRALNRTVTRCKESSQANLDLAEELKKGTINRIMEMDDVELALKVLTGELTLPGRE